MSIPNTYYTYYESRIMTHETGEVHVIVIFTVYIYRYTYTGIRVYLGYCRETSGVMCSECNTSIHVGIPIIHIVYVLTNEIYHFHICPTYLL